MLKQKKGPAFLLKTFDMLEKQQFKQIIDWTAEGTGFVVKNPTQLSEKVLPKYFKHSNMHSFIRQLNMYGFNKKRGSKVENYYFHPQFKKGDRDAISQMQRKAQKKGLNKEVIRQNGAEQVSIELEQNSQSFNKISKNLLSEKGLIEIVKKQAEVDNTKTLKNAIQLNTMNKALILEQIYHLANIQANNLLTYHVNQSQDDAALNLCQSEDYQEVVQKFIKAKEKYLKIMAIISDKVNSKVEKYEDQALKLSLINQIKNQCQTYKVENSQKFLKQTKIQIEKLPSKLLSYNSLEFELSQKRIDNERLAKDEHIEEENQNSVKIQAN